jgi:3-dehydroquinate synthase
MEKGVKTIEITGIRTRSSILIGERLGNVKAYVPAGNAIIVTDSNVRKLYESQFPSYPVIEIGMGETIKNLETVEYIYQRFLELGVDRSTFIIGIGGGIVCDITGFAASTFLRGLDFGFVSSSLLSQVDASVGGKNGVNFHSYKNIIGTFNQPRFVICDPIMLRTLPENELSCGFAEIVKHGAIADEAHFTFLENHASEALALKEEIIAQLVHDSVSIKAGVVNRDEREKGERRKLNFGHTFGHAVEKITGRPHGDAVSIGMVVAAALSHKRGLLGQESVDRLIELLNRLHLPTHIEMERARVLDALKKDKKRDGDIINFILLKRIGEAVVEEISIDELEKVLDDLREYC